MSGQRPPSENRNSHWDSPVAKGYTLPKGSNTEPFPPFDHQLYEELADRDRQYRHGPWRDVPHHEIHSYQEKVHPSDEDHRVTALTEGFNLWNSQSQRKGLQSHGVGSNQASACRCQPQPVEHFAGSDQFSSPGLDLPFPPGLQPPFQGQAPESYPRYVSTGTGAPLPSKPLQRHEALGHHQGYLASSPNLNSSRVQLQNHPAPPLEYNHFQDTRPKVNEGHHYAVRDNLKHQSGSKGKRNPNFSHRHHAFGPKRYQGHQYQGHVGGKETSHKGQYSAQKNQSLSYKADYNSLNSSQRGDQYPSAFNNNYIPLEDRVPPSSQVVGFDDRWIHNSEGMWRNNAQHGPRLMQGRIDSTPAVDIYRTPFIPAGSPNIAPPEAYRAHLVNLADTILSAPTVEWNEGMRGRRFSTFANVKRENGEPCYSVLTVSHIL